MIKDHLNKKRGNPLPPLHELHFPISSKYYFVCTIPQTGSPYHGVVILVIIVIVVIGGGGVDDRIVNDCVCGYGGNISLN